MGYIHIYTGNGKGKTTAAIGLAVRAALSGKKVYIGQFIKGKPYNEDKLVNFINNITIEKFGRGCFIKGKPEEEDFKLAKNGLEKVKNIISENIYDLIILDEINIALYYCLIDLKELIKLLKFKNSKADIVLTGRYAPAELIDIADLVTEMKEIKHYYYNNINAREGIEY